MGDISTDSEHVNLKNNNLDKDIRNAINCRPQTNGIDYAEPDDYEEDEDGNNNTEINSNKINERVSLKNNYHDSGNHLDIDNIHNRYQKDDEPRDHEYYMAKLQNGYLSTDGESESDEIEVENDNDNADADVRSMKSGRNNIIENRRFSDSLGNRSVISSIISFGKGKGKGKRNRLKKRSSKSSKMDKEMKHNLKHKQNGIGDENAKNKNKKKYRRQRSFHWGFTNDGSGGASENKQNRNKIRKHKKSHSSPSNIYIPNLPHCSM